MTLRDHAARRLRLVLALGITTAALAAALPLSGCSSSNPAGPSPGQSYLVDLTGTGDFLTIQEGLNVASDGDTVLIAPGVYTGPGNVDLDFGGVGLVLKGAETRDDVVIDCEGSGRGIYLLGGNSPVIENITIANGDAEQGGGIYAESVSPIINNVRFRANSSTDEGGGLYCRSASPALYNVLFDDNIASTSGGGMMCVSGSSPAMNEVVFYRNAAQGSGGGLSCVFSSPALTECVFFRNSAFFGGAVYCAEASPLITSCTLASNEAAYAGGIYCWDGSMPRTTNSIIALSTSGEALLCNGSSPFTTQCCIFGNEGGDQLCGTYSTSMLYVDPLFCDLAAGDLRLRSDSPCLPANNSWGIQIGALGQGCE